MKRIAIDWDGTLVEEKWPEMGDWLPGAVDALKRLASRYDEVVIFSCRLAKMDTDEITPRDNYDQIVQMNLMLDQAKIPTNVILWTKDYKPPADFYLDDKAVKFNGDWEETIWNIEMEQGVKDAKAFFANGDPGDEHQERIRTFETGATRDTSEGKPSYASYLSPLVLKSYGEYMMKHELQPNGVRREPGNWKKGMPPQAYLESLFRHLMDLWLINDGFEDEARESIEEALNAILFNASGYLHELLVD